jgi:phosphate transport system permease protein
MTAGSDHEERRKEPEVIEGRRRRTAAQWTAFTLLAVGSLFGFFFLGFILYWVISQGASAISWEFLTTAPKDLARGGGIAPMIVGSVYITGGALLVAMPFALGSAIWLSEYAWKGWWLRAIRIGVNTLAGVPSIVFGLVGLGLFVFVLGFGVSLLSGMCTLAMLSLPILIRASEEALRAVPGSFREGALALGATRWYMIRTVVLPTAIPGVLTGSVLGMARAIGETAPIMFTATAFMMTNPWPTSLFEKVATLPYHLYGLIKISQHYNETRPIQYGTVFVLMIVVTLLNLTAIVWRTHVRRKKAW